MRLLTSGRGGLFGVATACSAALVAGCASTGGGGTASVDVLTSESRAAMTPQDVLQSLKEGNARFVSGDSTPHDWLGEAEATAGGQYPSAIVLSCLDSRVPVEIVFDKGIGDIFVGRVAGNFENTDMLGSMEFGTAVAGSKVIVVLGHSSCGAVLGTIDQAELGLLTATLANIEPAVRDALRETGGERASSNAELANAAIEENVRQTVSDITSRSEVLRGLVESGDLLVVGAVYDLGTGQVTFLDS